MLRKQWGPFLITIVAAFLCIVTGIAGFSSRETLLPRKTGLPNRELAWVVSDNTLGFVHVDGSGYITFGASLETELSNG